MFVFPCQLHNSIRDIVQQNEGSLQDAILGVEGGQ